MVRGSLIAFLMDMRYLILGSFSRTSVFALSYRKYNIFVIELQVDAVVDVITNLQRDHILIGTYFSVAIASIVVLCHSFLLDVYLFNKNLSSRMHKVRTVM